MEPNIFDKIHDIDLKKTMETSYIDYAMSVIAARALPDVRDGLKPVQRRVLYSMVELNNGPDKPHRKSARIVGDTMGKYHPHGDSSIYGALVNMAQKWATRYPLVDGHGNFGSMDGDGAAAMRYTEARLSRISMEMLADIGKNTVDFMPNFDETEKEPTVLPARFPNILVNGGTGIAVGMATNIPPHNLREVIAAVVKIIDNRVEEDRPTTIEELMEIVKGPDFPTGATILGKAGIEEAYRTGRGKIRVRAVYNIETMANGKSRIIVTELPYAVNKARLIEKIAELVKDKKVDGITDLRDESNREGLRICIELRRDVNANVIMNRLLKHTQLQDTFGVIMLALVNNEPRILNLQQILEYYLKHQEDVVTRRTKYDLNKAEERALEEQRRRPVSAWELAQSAVDKDEEAHQKEEYEPKEMKMPETKSASQLAAEAIAKAKEEDQMKLEAEKRAERLMEEARKRGKDPMEFALHQQEILNYMEKNSDELVSFEDYEDLSPEEKLEIEKELYREKQIEAGVAPEDISDELPDEILEQSGIAPDQTAGEQNSQESAGQGDGTTAQQTSQSQGMPTFSDDMLRMISQEVVQENAEMILAEDANADLGLINETIFENLKNLMSQTGGAVTQEDMESLIGEVISRNTSSDSEEKQETLAQTETGTTAETAPMAFERRKVQAVLLEVEWQERGNQQWKVHSQNHRASQCQR